MYTVKSIPSGISPVGNIADIVIEADETLYVYVKDGEDTLLLETYMPDFNNLIKIDIKDIIEQQLITEVPNIATWKEKNIKSFSIEIETATSDYPELASTFFATAGGAKYYTPTTFYNRFRTHQPAVKVIPIKNDTTIYDEYLYFVNTTGTTVNLTLDGTLKNGMLLNKRLIDNLPQSKEIEINVFETIEEDIRTITDFELSIEKNGTIYAKQKYILIDALPQEIYFGFVNSLGGFDTLRCTGKQTHLPEFEINTAQNAETEISYNINKKDNKTANSGYLNKDSINLFLDFFNSTQQYFFNEKRNTYEKIIVEEPEVEYSPQENLTAFTFKWRLANKSKYLL